MDVSVRNRRQRCVTRLERLTIPLLRLPSAVCSRPDGSHGLKISCCLSAHIIPFYNHLLILTRAGWECPRFRALLPPTLALLVAVDFVDWTSSSSASPSLPQSTDAVADYNSCDSILQYIYQKVRARTRTSLRTPPSRTRRNRPRPTRGPSPRRRCDQPCPPARRLRPLPPLPVQEQLPCAVRGHLPRPQPGRRHQGPQRRHEPFASHHVRPNLAPHSRSQAADRPPPTAPRQRACCSSTKTRI